MIFTHANLLTDGSDSQSLPPENNATGVVTLPAWYMGGMGCKILQEFLSALCYETSECVIVNFGVCGGELCMLISTDQNRWGWGQLCPKKKKKKKLPKIA